MLRVRGRGQQVRSDFANVVMRYKLGRLLQMIGLFILPFAIASNLMEKVGLGQSMLIAAGGIAVFYVGYLVQPHS